MVFGVVGVKRGDVSGADLWGRILGQERTRGALSCLPCCSSGKCSICPSPEMRVSRREIARVRGAGRVKSRGERYRGEKKEYKRLNKKEKKEVE